MVKLNKKLWSFNMGCSIVGALIWLTSYVKNIPIPQFLSLNSDTSVTIYTTFIIIIAALLVTAIILFLVKTLLNIQCNDHTFWLVLPILCFLVFTVVMANILIFTMLSAAIPSLLLILIKARKKKKRKIFDMEKALS